MLIEKKHDTWDEHLSEIKFGYNTVPHALTEVSPAMMMYGTQPRKPLTARRAQDLAAEQEVQRKALDAWHDRVSHLRKMRKKAVETSRDAQERQAQYYDVRHCPDNYRICDIVMKKNYVLSYGADKRSAK